MSSFNMDLIDRHYGMVDLAAKLFEIGCIKDRSRSPEGKGFRLKLHEKKPEAPLSPIYIDLRMLRSFPAVLDLATSVFTEIATDLGIKYDLVADVPTAATPIVTLFSHYTKKPMITPREEKGHGSGAKIDGVCEAGQWVLVIDDLITQADSKFAALRVLRSARLNVAHLLVLVDCEQGGVSALQDEGYNVYAGYKLSHLLQFYRHSGKISEEMYKEVKGYLGFPA